MLEIREKILGPNHRRVAYPLRLMATIYTAQGEYVKAEPLYKRALGILEQSVPNHPNVAATLESMAERYTKTGRDDEAKGLLARAERIRAKQ